MKNFEPVKLLLSEAVTRSGLGDIYERSQAYIGPIVAKSDLFLKPLAAKTAIFLSPVSLAALSLAESINSYMSTISLKPLLNSVNSVFKPIVKSTVSFLAPFKKSIRAARIKATAQIKATARSTWSSVSKWSSGVAGKCLAIASNAGGKLKAVFGPKDPCEGWLEKVQKPY